MGASFPMAQSLASYTAGGRAETYFGFQQVITGFMVW